MFGAILYFWSVRGAFVFGAIFYRLLFRSSPLTEEFSDKLVRQVFRGAQKLIHVPNLAGSNRRDLQSDN